MPTDNSEILQQLKKAREKKPPKEKKPIAKVSVKRQKEIAAGKKLFEEDKEFYLSVWNASPHKCQCGCNAKLGREPLTIFFHHLLEKRDYPQYRHTHPNIMLLAGDCHRAYEDNPLNRPEVMRRREVAEKECETWNSDLTQN